MWFLLTIWIIHDKTIFTGRAFIEPFSICQHGRIQSVLHMWSQWLSRKSQNPKDWAANLWLLQCPPQIAAAEWPTGSFGCRSTTTREISANIYIQMVIYRIPKKVLAGIQTSTHTFAKMKIWYQKVSPPLLHQRVHTSILTKMGFLETSSRHTKQFFTRNTFGLNRSE